MEPNELRRLRLRTMDFVLEKNDVISALYESELPWDRAAEIETLLCNIVNKFADDMFPGIWDPKVMESWFKE